MFIATGQVDSALATIRHACERDPSSSISGSVEGWLLYFARRYEEAIVHLENVRDMEPNFWRPYMDLSFCRMHSGRYDQALTDIQTAISLNENTTTRAILAMAYAYAGKTGDAHDVLHRLSVQSSYVSRYALALAYAGLGDFERALDYLEEAYVEREWFLIFLEVEPALDQVRESRRFRELVRKVGLGKEGISAPC
jgi:tetratricopeptide (TPR) repeat protein